MNRLSTFCALALAVLTLAAFVDHVQHHELPGKEPDAAPLAATPTPESTPAIVEQPGVAAASTAIISSYASPTARGDSPTQEPQLTPSPRPAVDTKALKKRITGLILQPLRDHRMHAGTFSRVRRRDPIVELEIEEFVRPPSEAPPTFIAFRVTERRDRMGAKSVARQLAAGRLHVATGVIQLAPGATKKPADSAFEDVAKALVRLGVDKNAKKFPW